MVALVVPLGFGPPDAEAVSSATGEYQWWTEPTRHAEQTRRDRQRRYRRDSAASVTV
jgi:hypothetical protein